MTAPLLRSNGSVAQVRLPGADDAPERTQGDTRAQGGNVGALLFELAGLREREALVLRNLATELEVRLDVLADPSLMGRMETPLPLAHETDSLMSVKDVSGLLGISETTVRRMRKRGELPPAIDLGGVWRWRRSTIETWIAAREGAPL